MNKKKILIVSKKIPYPLSQGGAIAEFFFLKKLITVFDVSFCSIVYNENQENNLNNLKNEMPQIDFFTLNLVKNENLIGLNVIYEKCKKLKRRFENKFVKLYLKKESIKNVDNFDTEFNYENKEFVSFFNSIIENHNFDIIQLEFFETISLLSIIPRNIKTVFVHHEVRSKRNSLVKTTNPIYREYIKNITAIIENSLLSIADKIIVFNEDDKFFLETVDSTIIVSPFGIPESLVIKKQSSIYFNKFIFVGSEFHFPNNEGLEWFLDTIYLPNSEVINWPIYITGFWSEGFKKKYKENKKVIFTGYLQSLESVYENSVLLAPIISGSGIRTKILESFANKIPVISTPFASEGLYESTEVLSHIIHFNSSLDFLEAFNKISKENDFLTELANNGFNYFSENFSEDSLFQKRLAVYFD